ncbi:MAG: hypothetical protein LBJ14_04600 [Desulfarculales bacterium]|nr:hypothetical protein [Desulfarculales bacterium]
MTLGRDVRLALTADVDYYVSPDGDDSKDGLSSGTAWASVKHALEYCYYKLDPGLYTATINVAAGTYNEGLIILQGGLTHLRLQPASRSNVKLVGAGKTSVIIKGMIVLSRGCLIAENLTVDCSSIQNITPYCFRAESSMIATNNVNFKLANDGGVILSTIASNVSVGGVCAISGGQSNLVDIFAAVYFSRFSFGGNGSIAYSGQSCIRAHIFCTHHSNMDLGSTTFSGSVTGSRYQCNVNSFINTGGGGANYLPGTIAGVVVNNSNYQ